MTRQAMSRIVPATDADLEWLHNDFDEEELRRSDERDLQSALTATPTPKHWIPIDVERVG